jgi:hypothetical protein
MELNPIIGSDWMPKGQQRRIPIPGVNKRINAFITMLWPSKKVLYSIHRRRRG